MIRTALFYHDGKITYHSSVEPTTESHVKWYWVDLAEPTEDEIQCLSGFFQFHHLAIEDCVNLLQRPKLDDYGDYQFFVLHSLSNTHLRPEEVNIFRGENFIVSFHMKPNKVIEKIWNQIKDDGKSAPKGPDYLLYQIIDGLVDQYFPVLNKFDDELERLESQHFLRPNQHMTNRIFKIRRELHSLRRSLEPYREVVKGIIHPQNEKWKTKHRLFYSDVSDHLAKLLDMTDSFLQVGFDLIDSYTSLSSQRMNRIMMILTVITTIFMPLTLIVGIYGMNFDNMPELHWKYGYYAVWAVMVLIAVAMVNWFKRKGWFS